MADRVVKIEVPSSLLQLGIDRAEVHRRIIEWLVLSLFTEDRISSGKTARLLGIGRVEFLALLRKRGIPLVDYSEDDLEDEFAAVRELETEQ